MKSLSTPGSWVRSWKLTANLLSHRQRRGVARGTEKAEEASGVDGRILTTGAIPMSTVLDDPQTQPSTSPSQRLRSAMAAARVSVHWFGVRKSLTPQQTAQAADAFGAEDRFLSAAKKLLDTTHPSFKAVTAVRSRLQNYWRGVSLPYPEPGVRLIRRDQVEEFAKSDASVPGGTGRGRGNPEQPLRRHAS